MRSRTECMDVVQQYIAPSCLCHAYILIFSTIVEYRHGFDHNIPCIHIPYALWSYVLFAQLSVYSPVYLPSGFVSPLFIQCASMCGTVASANCLATGFSWGRSQWGNLPFADSKIALMCILSPFHVTPMPLITYGTFSLSSRYTMYVPYHIPILKYNVFRFPEVHQRAPLYLLNAYIDSNTLSNLILSIPGVSFAFTLSYRYMSHIVKHTTVHGFHESPGYLINAHVLPQAVYVWM